jgi:Tol biopolymer transport system component
MGGRRSIGFDPKGDTVAFFARKGKRRNLFLVSCSREDLRSVPMDLDQAQAPACCPTAARLFSALKEGVSDIYLLDLESGVQEPHPGRVLRRRPADLARREAGRLHRGASAATTRSTLPAGRPRQKTQLTFGPYDDTAPTFSPDGKRSTTRSDEDDEIYNLRSLDLSTGVIQQYTDAWAGT